MKPWLLYACAYLVSVGLNAILATVYQSMLRENPAISTWRLQPIRNTIDVLQFGMGLWLGYLIFRSKGSAQ